jgi:outer membrane protein assembly factor BamB
MRRLAFALCAANLWGGLLAGTASADNWAQWRGPKNDGICNETGLPTEWSETKNIKWTLPMPGMGSSTPAVWGDRLFLTSEEGKDLVALCFDTSGEPLWKKTLGSTVNKARGDEGNGASASPTTDGKHVWFFVGSGELACYDFAGERKWLVNLQDLYGKFRIQFGMHSTPVLDEGKLYLQLMHTGKQIVACHDAATGKSLWKIDRPSDGRDECEHSYASPFLWRNGSSAYLVTHGNDYTVAHDLKDGHEIWRLGGLNPKMKYNNTLRFVASPVCTPDLIVVPSAKNGPVMAVKPDAKGAFEPGSKSIAWWMPNGTPDVPSPLVHDGLVYLAGEKGIITVLDAKTGEKQYSERTRDVRHRASPIYADGKIYITARDGTVFVLKAGRKYELLATNRVPDETAASPAISNGVIFLRGFKNLYAIGK